MKQLKERLISDYEHKGCKVKDVETPISFQLKAGKMITVPYYEVELTVEGYKKPQKLMITMTHCPTCGTKLLDDETIKEIEHENITN